MIKTINEKTAGFRTLWSGLFIYICLMLMLVSARGSFPKGNTIIGIVSFIAFMFFLFMFWYAGYSLGWEYKRLEKKLKVEDKINSL